MNSTAAFAIWFVEWCLEVFGAFRSAKRSLFPLFMLLSFAAAADLCNVIVALSHGNLYRYTYWMQKGGKYFLLFVLASYICGKLMNERAYAFRAGGMALLLGIAVSILSRDGWDLTDKLLDAAISANMLLGAFIALSWMSRKTRLDSPWNLIAGGLIGLLVWDASMSYLWKFWPSAQNLFWIGEVSSLIIWNAAAGKKVEAFGFMRRSLSPRGEQLPEIESKGAVN